MAKAKSRSETARPAASIANLKPPFQPGQSGNPGGKPVNARNQITRKFLEVLAADFEENGKKAIVQARESDPMGYVRAVAGLLPKEFVIERPLEQLSDEELVAAIADIKARLGSLEAPGAPPVSAQPDSTVRH